MKITTVYPGPVGHEDCFLLSIANRLAANPPAGYTPMTHMSVEELCGQITNAGSQLEVMEIISHGNPYFLGVIDTSAIPQVTTALKTLSTTAQIYLSGCNTGTWIANTNQADIGLSLASAAPCQVLASLGYLNSGTFAENNVKCSPNDWGQEADMVYEGSIQASGADVFTHKAMSMVGAYTPKVAPPRVVNINSPSISNDLRATLNGIFSQLASLTPSQITINARTAPNVSVAANAQMFDFYYDGSYISQRKSGKTWHVALSPSQLSLLATLWLPRPAVRAVVADPTAAPVPTS